MFFRSSIILGTILSLLFVLFCSYILFIDQGIASEGKSISVLFMSANLFFLLINILCIRINKSNSEHVLISRKLKNAGKVFFVLSIVSIVVVLFSGLAALLSRLYSDIIIQEKHLLYFFMLIVLLLLSGIFAINNLIYFRKISKKNNKIMNDLIDDIRVT